MIAKEDKEDTTMLDSLRSFLHMLSLPQDEYESYCREKRLERYNKYGGRIRSLPLHSFAHRILIPLIKAELYVKGTRLTVLRDRDKVQEGYFLTPYFLM